MIGDLAFVVLAVDSVDQYGCRDTIHAPCLNDLGLRRAGDFVVDDFLGLAALVAAGAAFGGLLLLLSVAAGQFGADGHRAFLVVGRG